MKQGNNRVYKLIKGEDTKTLYFPKVDTVSKRVRATMEVAQYKKLGYSVLCVLYVDKETYLNLRIDETVREILQTDKVEQDLRTKFSEREMTKDTYLSSMTANSDYRKSCMKKLEKQMKRLLFYEDLDCHNEIAVELFNTVTSNKPLWLN